MAEFVMKKVPGGGRRALDVDVFRPSGPSNGVAVILIHGGGWARGHRSMVHGYGAALADRGFVAVAAEYRLLPEAPWPSQIDDVRDIVRWTKAQASSLGIDPAKVALQGYAAGGHIALLVAGSAPGSPYEGKLGGDAAGTEVAAVVAFCAPARLDEDLKVPGHQPVSQMLNGGGMDAARAASPIYYAHPGFPSTFLLTGLADYMETPESKLALAKAFVDGGVEVEFHYFHSQKHEFSSTPGMLAKVMDEVAFFYQRTLLEREAMEQDAREHNIFARASSIDEFAQMIAEAPGLP